MKIILTSETSIRLVPDTGPMTVEARDVEQQYSPFHMLGSGLAFCTFSVMYSWATHVKLPAEDLVIDVEWEFAEDPHRVGRIALTFDWPSLPPKRLNAAKRAAELCAIHATLTHAPTIDVRSASDLSMEGTTMTASRDEPRDDRAQHEHEHEHEHTHADGTRHSHPHTHEGEHQHAHGADEAISQREVEVQRGSDETNQPADLPPRPAQQGDGQEAGTARPNPSAGAR